MAPVRLLPLPGVFQPHSDSWMLADSLRHERLGADAASSTSARAAGCSASSLRTATGAG